MSEIKMTELFDAPQVFHSADMTVVLNINHALFEDFADTLAMNVATRGDGKYSVSFLMYGTDASRAVLYRGWISGYLRGIGLKVL